MEDFEYPKFYKHGILFVGFKTLGTIFIKDLLVGYKLISVQTFQPML